MLVTALEKERERFFQNGLLEGKIEAARAMLAKGMEITLISEITNLPEERLLQLKDEVSSIKE